MRCVGVRVSAGFVRRIMFDNGLQLAGEWKVHLILLGVTIYVFRHVHRKRKLAELLASYGPDVKLPPHLRSFVPYLVRINI